jgi:hypothetical protein
MNYCVVNRRITLQTLTKIIIVVPIIIIVIITDTQCLRLAGHVTGTGKMGNGEKSDGILEGTSFLVRSRRGPMCKGSTKTETQWAGCVHAVASSCEHCNETSSSIGDRQSLHLLN